MPLDQPPIPVSRQEEFPFKSEVFPDIVYILRPYGQDLVASSVVNRRMIAAKRAPLTERMRALLLSTDLSPWLSAGEISRAYEAVHALVNGALGIPDEDLRFLDQVVEPILIEHNSEYHDLTAEDEALAYDLRMRNLADTLKAVEEKGQRYTWPPKSKGARYEYVRSHMDPLDISLITIQGRNMQRVSPDTEKNSEVPSTSA